MSLNDHGVVVVRPELSTAEMIRWGGPAGIRLVLKHNLRRVSVRPNQSPACRCEKIGLSNAGMFSGLWLRGLRGCWLQDQGHRSMLASS